MPTTKSAARAPKTLSNFFKPPFLWPGLFSLVSNACRLIVERLQLGDYFLRLSGVYLQKPSTSTPVPRQNHHLHVCRFACHCFDHRRRFVLGAGLKLVFTRLGVDRKPATISQAVHFFAV